MGDFLKRMAGATHQKAWQSLFRRVCWEMNAVGAGSRGNVRSRINEDLSRQISSRQNHCFRQLEEFLRGQKFFADLNHLDPGR